MKHHVKLVKGDDHTTSIEEVSNKKQITTLTLGFTKKELAQMKALSGLKGQVSNDQIIRAYIKSKMSYGY